MRAVKAYIWKCGLCDAGSQTGKTHPNYLSAESSMQFHYVTVHNQYYQRTGVITLVNTTRSSR